MFPAIILKLPTFNGQNEIIREQYFANTFRYCGTSRLSKKTLGAKFRVTYPLMPIFCGLYDSMKIITLLVVSSPLVLREEVKVGMEEVDIEITKYLRN